MKRFGIITAVTGAVALGAHAFLTRAITISTSIPGSYDPAGAGTSPSAFIANFYQYALSIAGILAFGIIVYGGVRYMIAVGNPSGESDAKEWIKAAIMGLLLLAGAYLILNLINPNLVNLTLPALNPSGAQNTTSTQVVAWSPTSPPKHTTQADCSANCYLPNKCIQDAKNSDYWSCVAPKNTPTSTAKGVACPPGSSNICTPPKLCSGYPTLTGVLYSCALAKGYCIVARRRRRAVGCCLGIRPCTLRPRFRKRPAVKTKKRSI